MRVLVTGFEAFGKETVNPSGEIVRRLPDRIGDIEICRSTLPVVYGAAGDEAIRAIEENKPDAVLCLGQAGGRDAVTPEHVAINVEDSPSPDNAGVVRTDEPICADGPAAYFATIPVKAVRQAILSEGIPSNVSNSAGTFVCNHVMYRVLHHISLRNLPIRAGFVHVPFLPEQTHNAPSIPLDDLMRAIRAAIVALRVL